MTSPAYLTVVIRAEAQAAPQLFYAVRSSRPAVSPEDGCSSCGADVCDVVVRGIEGYCWSCIDTWPATAAGPLDQLGVNVLPGHERSVR